MDLDQSGAGAETISCVHISQSWIFPPPPPSLFRLPSPGCAIYNWSCASKSFYQESVLIFITEELKPVPDNLEISGEL